MAEICDRLHYVEIAVDLVGMNSEDGNWIPNVIAGDLAEFAHLSDRLHQGFVNELLAMRMMMGKMATDPQTMPAGKPTIDTTHRYYRGDSQGGIGGGVYMAISTDVTRGLLDNTGAPYDLILDRSRDFSPFFLVLKGVYTDPAQQQLGIDLIQQLWDNAEPDGYIPYITRQHAACAVTADATTCSSRTGSAISRCRRSGRSSRRGRIGAKNLQRGQPRGVGHHRRAERLHWQRLRRVQLPEPASQSPLTNVPPPVNYPGCSCISGGVVQNECSTDTCDTDPHDELRQAAVGAGHGGPVLQDGADRADVRGRRSVRGARGVVDGRARVGQRRAVQRAQRHRHDARRWAGQGDLPRRRLRLSRTASRPAPRSTRALRGRSRRARGAGRYPTVSMVRRHQKTAVEEVPSRQSAVRPSRVPKAVLVRSFRQTMGSLLAIAVAHVASTAASTARLTATSMSGNLYPLCSSGVAPWRAASPRVARARRVHGATDERRLGRLGAPGHRRHRPEQHRGARHLARRRRIEGDGDLHERPVVRLLLGLLHVRRAAPSSPAGAPP